jgi:hypothetical protein
MKKSRLFMCVLVALSAVGCGSQTTQTESITVISERLSKERPETSTALSTTTVSVVPETLHKIAFLGDVSCAASKRRADRCADEDVRDMIAEWGPERVVIVGDVQYPSHGMRDYTESFLPTWGAFRSITKAVPGNHEYEMSQASGYYEAWGADAGMWSERIGEWLLVGINTSDGCGVVKCDVGSEQYNWLAQQIQNTECVVVFGHHPRVSSGAHGDTKKLQDIWELMESNDVEAYVSGHDHHYERVSGDIVTQYVVGTGGAGLRGANSEGETVVENRHGFLAFTASSRGAEISFVATDGAYDTHTLTCS